MVRADRADRAEEDGVYGWLWRVLPGPTAAKVVQVALLAAVVVAVCFTWVFPAVAPLLPSADTTVGDP